LLVTSSMFCRIPVVAGDQLHALLKVLPLDSEE
jgi:hypothetical protein